MNIYDNPAHDWNDQTFGERLHMAIKILVVHEIITDSDGVKARERLSRKVTKAEDDG